MQDAGAASENAVSEMQQLRDQMLAMQKQLTQTQEKLKNYERTSLVVSRDAKVQKAEARPDKHFDVVDDEKKDEIFDDRFDEETHDMFELEEDADDVMQTDDFTHAKSGKKSSAVGSKKSDRDACSVDWLPVYAP